jgi:hypothetical protein
VILYLNFEELAALGECAELVLHSRGDTGHAIAAPPQFIAEIEHFAQSLSGDITITSLDEHRRMLDVVTHLLAGCRTRLDKIIVEQHAAAEDAVAAYFSFAHVLSVSDRLESMGSEMAAIVELMTGEHRESETARRFSFED